MTTDTFSISRARFSDYLELTKPRLVSLVLCSFSVGFFLAQEGPFNGILFFTSLLGTALVAAGSMALNQWMEREEDAKMIRTAMRPLPAGRLHPYEALIFGVTLFLTECVTFLLKVFFHHPRPLDGLILADDRYSFPSGHATIAVAFYGIVATVLLRQYPERRWLRVGVVSLVGGLIMLIGASRVALGVHYTEDVLFGYAIGALSWVIFFFVSRPKGMKRN